MSTTNPHLMTRLQAVQQALLVQRNAAVGLPAAIAGPERETFLREFMQKLFPAHRRFSTGVITDRSGKLSGQVDIAVEYGFTPSFPMPSTEQRLLLAEAVALVIEVKSDLMGQWDQLEDTTRGVKSLNRKISTLMTFGPAPPNKIPVVAVGYLGHKTIDGLVQRLANTPTEARPDAALAWISTENHLPKCNSDFW